MQVDVVPLTDFVHDAIKATRNVSMSMDQNIANDLESAGLIRIKMMPHHANKMMGAPQNKMEAPGKLLVAGEDQPSSSSQAARVLQPTTLDESKRGRGRPRKIAT